jgi:hypothetical protein
VPVVASTYHVVTSAVEGLTHRVGEVVALNLGVGASRHNADDNGTSVAFGSVQAVGLRQLPLVQAELNRRWYLDGYALAT